MVKLPKFNNTLLKFYKIAISKELPLIQQAAFHFIPLTPTETVAQSAEKQVAVLVLQAVEKSYISSMKKHDAAGFADLTIEKREIKSEFL